MFSQYTSPILTQRLSPTAPELKMEEDGPVEVFYSPFDHVTPTARLAIVGITPGAQQSGNALRAAHEALRQGLPPEQALRIAKGTASFSGAMRSNLVAMLDDIGVHRWLGVPSTALLWQEHLDLVHFTSVLRYPVFVRGKDYGGSSPNMLAHPLLRRHIDSWFRREMEALPHVLWVPLGDKVTAVLRDVARQHAPAAPILEGLPHPSGANSERIAYFLRRKSRKALSAKTNAARIDEGRSRALDVMKTLCHNIGTAANK